MQELTGFYLDSESIVREDELPSLVFPLHLGDRIFFLGELGAGKTTLIRSFLRMHFSDPDLIVRSPTYTYYQRYAGLVIGNKGQPMTDKGLFRTNTSKIREDTQEFGTINRRGETDQRIHIGGKEGAGIFHFDLYRIEDPGELEHIGAIEIFDNISTICLIEWPEILGDLIKPSVVISLERHSEDKRKVSIYRMATNL